jgi:hypothetical protein
MVIVSGVIALVLFVFAAFGVKFDEVDIVDLGLAFLSLAVVLGAIPHTFVWGRKTQ